MVLEVPIRTETCPNRPIPSSCCDRLVPSVRVVQIVVSSWHHHSQTLSPTIVPCLPIPSDPSLKVRGPASSSSSSSSLLLVAFLLLLLLFLLLVWLQCCLNGRGPHFCCSFLVGFLPRQYRIRTARAMADIPFPFHERHGPSHGVPTTVASWLGHPATHIMGRIFPSEHPCRSSRPCPPVRTRPFVVFP